MNDPNRTFGEALSNVSNVLTKYEDLFTAARHDLEIAARVEAFVDQAQGTADALARTIAERQAELDAYPAKLEAVRQTHETQLQGLKELYAQRRAGIEKDYTEFKGKLAAQKARDEAEAQTARLALRQELAELTAEAEAARKEHGVLAAHLSDIRSQFAGVGKSLGVK